MTGFLRRNLLITGFAVMVGTGLLAACSASDSKTSSTEGYMGPNASYNGATGGAGYVASGIGGASSNEQDSNGAIILPPEDKVTLAIEVPKASDNYVYSANPDRNSVAIINPVTLAIQTVSVDAAPQGLQTLPNRDAAVVVNAGSSTVSVLTTDSSHHTSAVTRAVMRGANKIAVAPDGNHALIYYDSEVKSTGPLADSPQNMSALDLTGSEPIVYQVTVGYHPTAVNYTADSSRAYVVSDDGISIVDLEHLNTAANRLSESVRLYDSLVTSTANVAITPDGTYAVAHQEYSPVLRLVDLTLQDHSDLDLRSLFADSASDAGAPTSLDVSDVTVSPDGTFLLAVVRNMKTLVQVPIPEGFADESLVKRIELPDVLIGAVNIGPDGHYAVLYTTLDEYNEQHITILNLTDLSDIQTVNLHKMVDAVAFDPTGKTAYVLHVKSNGDPKQADITMDQQTARQYGFSMVDLASATSKLLFSDSQPGQVAALPDGTALFVLFPDKAPWSVQRVDLVGFAVDSIGIGSQPTGIGFVPKAQQIFVSQAQSDGRMTFIEWNSLRIKSVAGYELNSSIWE